MSCPGISFASIQVRICTTLVEHSQFFSNIVEPIGSSKPKFPEDISSKTINREQSNEVTLLCPAQGYPLPAFRLGSCHDH